MFSGCVKAVGGLQDDWVAHDTGGYGHIRHAGVDAHGVLVEDVDALDSFYSAPKIVVANGGVFHAQEVELHGFSVDLAAIVE